MPTKTRPPILFWLLAAAVSVYCAEIISGSSPYPFFDGWGLSVVLPLYGLHLLVLGGFIFRYGKPSWPALYFGGVLFGLYEAYITKMIFNAPWDLPLHIAGIDLAATTTLILWWHPFMAFMLPLFVLERFASSSHTLAGSLPPGARRVLARPRNRFLIAGLLGLLQASASPPWGGLASALGGLAVVGVLLWLWRRGSGSQRPLAELLPSGPWLGVLAVGLAGLYIWAGPRLRLDALPGLSGQATVWLLYAAFIWLLLRALRLSRQAPVADAKADHPLDQPIPLIATYLFVTLAAGFLPDGIKTLVFLLNALLGSLFGIYVLVAAVRALRNERMP